MPDRASVYCWDREGEKWKIGPPIFSKLVVNSLFLGNSLIFRLILPFSDGVSDVCSVTPPA
jgi:hypothetical protein